MKSILEELFYGNICPSTDCHSTDKETVELMSYVADHHETHLEELTDKQRETLEKLDDCYSELAGINERKFFVYAFKLMCPKKVRHFCRYTFLWKRKNKKQRKYSTEFIINVTVEMRKLK